MGKKRWPGIRPGSKPLHVYNEGLMVYLLDQKNLKKLMASDADFESGFDQDEDEADPDLLELTKAGLFLSYELEQDDEVTVEVVAGPPLTEAELAVGRWFAPQQGFLKLPSGKLRVHTPNTLPLDDDEPEDKPGRFDTEPGDYVVTLYRLDWDELRNDGIVADDDDVEDEDDIREWEGPQEVIVLTPAAEAEAIPENPCYLPYPTPSADVWKGVWEYDGTVFRGLAMTHYWWDNIFVNIDRTAVERMGLEPGMSFRAAIGDFVIDAIYAGEGHPLEMNFGDWPASQANGRPEFGVAFRPTHDEDSSNALSIQRNVSTQAFKIHERWMPVVVTILPDRYVLPPRRPSD